MCSLQIASDVNPVFFSTEQLDDDYITSLFSQNINGPEAVLYQPSHGNQISVSNTLQSSVQMDHSYSDNVPSTLLSPVWDKPSIHLANTTRLNMSTYFSTFDPSSQFQSDGQLVMPYKLDQKSMGKIHKARINLVPTKNGHFKAVMKRKRKRTVFRTDQIEAMEEVFARKPYVTKEDRQLLVEKLNISDKSVKVWFQNRRLKNKRDEDQLSDEENQSSPDPIDRLHYVESEISERTNELGYVTLDDRIMNDLVCVIDDFLRKPRVADNNCEDIEMVETNRAFSSIPEYEPISPASTIDTSNEDNSESVCMDNEYLERLIDIESIIANK